MQKATRHPSTIRLRPLAVAPGLKDRIYAQLKAELTGPQIYLPGGRAQDRRERGGRAAALDARDAGLAERLVREHTLNLHAHVARHWTDSDSCGEDMVA